MVIIRLLTLGWHGPDWLGLLQHSDGIPLQQDPAHILPFILFRVNFNGIVEHHVHVFVETNNLSFNLKAGVFVEPQTNPSLFL